MKKDAPVVLPVLVDSPLGKAYGHTTDARIKLQQMREKCKADERCGEVPCPCGFWQDALVTAAPDLLAALKLCLAELQAYDVPSYQLDPQRVAVDAARAAIAKASGADK